MAETGLPRRSILERLPIQVTLEPRLSTPPRWYSLFLSLASVVVALLIGAVVLAIAGGNPWATYAHIGKAAFGSIGVISDTLVKAIPLMLVGLACTIAFRMKLWNIGAEGQFFLGAWGASAVVLAPLLPENAPQWLFIVCMMLAGMLCGAVWGFIPGILKARFNVNEVISTLMMNYIAISWNNYWIYAVWTQAGFQMSKVFPKNAWLPRLADYAAEVPLFFCITGGIPVLARVGVKGPLGGSGAPPQWQLGIAGLRALIQIKHTPK